MEEITSTLITKATVFDGPEQARACIERLQLRLWCSPIVLAADENGRAYVIIMRATLNILTNEPGPEAFDGFLCAKP